MLKKIDIDKDIDNKLAIEFPDSAKMQKRKGNTTLTYVSWPAVVDKLNYVFGVLNWDWEIKSQWIEESVPKIDRNTREPIPQNPVAHVVGRLTVRTVDDNGNVKVTVREAPGCQSIIGGQSEQESCYKGASSDALKKCASLLGVGLELSRSSQCQAYYDELNYVDPWDLDNAREVYKDQLDYLSQIKDGNNYTDNDMDNLVRQFFQDANASMAWIVPENIQSFVDYIDALIAQQEE